VYFVPSSVYPLRTTRGEIVIFICATRLISTSCRENNEIFLDHDKQATSNGGLTQALVEILSSRQFLSYETLMTEINLRLGEEARERRDIMQEHSKQLQPAAGSESESESSTDATDVVVEPPPHIVLGSLHKIRPNNLFTL